MPNHNPKFNSKLMAHETFKNPTIVAERTQPTASERGQDGTEPNQTPYAIDSAQTVPVPRPKIPEGGKKKWNPKPSGTLLKFLLQARLGSTAARILSSSSA
jgi:hypothetical protein